MHTLLKEISITETIETRLFTSKPIREKTSTLLFNRTNKYINKLNWEG